MGAHAAYARKLLMGTAATVVLFSGQTATAAERCANYIPTYGTELATELDERYGDTNVQPAPFSPACLAQGGATGQLGLTVTGNVGKNLVNSIADKAIDPALGSGSGGGGAPGSNATPISMFLISGVNKLDHDGYNITMGGAAMGRTPEYNELDAGLTLGVRLDGSRALGLAPNTLTFGLFGNYTKTDIDLGAVPGYPKAGKIDVDSWSVGGYGLLTDGWKYGMVTVSGTFGSPSSEDYVYGSKSDFNTTGISSSAVAGLLIPVGDAKIDLRSAITYVTVTGDDHTDSLGIHYTDAKLEDLSGSISARLFGVLRTEAGVLRPFVQGGVSQRFHYKSEVTAADTPFNFDDGDTTVFARAGVDFDLGRSTQAYISVRGDSGEDVQAISGQLGLTFKLD